MNEKQQSTKSLKVRLAIRRAMRVHGVSQQNLADDLALSQAAVSAKLLGRRPITIEELQTMAQTLGVEPAELWT